MTPGVELAPMTSFMSALLGDGCLRTSIVGQGRAGAIQQVGEATQCSGVNVFHAATVFFLPENVTPQRP